MRFHRGDAVEVMSKEEGFEGSYYPATMVSKISRNEYMIQYKTLLKDDESGPLRQIHTADEIRPKPPEIPVINFRMHAEVDAYDGDGWWVAVVIGKKKSNYTVYFDTTEEEMNFALENLRVHQDWINNKWVLSNGEKNVKGKKKRKVFMQLIFLLPLLNFGSCLYLASPQDLQSVAGF